MTPGEREELAWALPSNAPIVETLDAIAPIIDRMVAERVAAAERDSERRATAAIVAFIAKQGGMQWLIDQIGAGDHLRGEG